MSRHDPTIEIICDECFTSMTTGLTATARGYDERDVTADIKKEGWLESDDEVEALCPDCKRHLDQVDAEAEQVADDLSSVGHLDGIDWSELEAEAEVVDPLADES